MKFTRLPSFLADWRALSPQERILLKHWLAEVFLPAVDASHLRAYSCFRPPGVSNRQETAAGLVAWFRRACAWQFLVWRNRHLGCRASPRESRHPPRGVPGNETPTASGPVVTLLLTLSGTTWLGCILGVFRSQSVVHIPLVPEKPRLHGWGLGIENCSGKNNYA